MFDKVVSFIKNYYNVSDEIIPLHEPRFIGNDKKYVIDAIDSTYVSSVGKYVDLFEEMICEYTGNTGGVELLPKRTWDTSGKRFGSTDKAEKELGFKASMPLNEGLKMTVEWTKANLDMIERTIAKHEGKMKQLNA